MFSIKSEGAFSNTIQKVKDKHVSASSSFCEQNMNLNNLGEIEKLLISK